MKRLALLAFAFSCPLLVSSQAAAAGITLKKIHFPASLTGTGGPTTPPPTVPLSQVIVFEFSDTPQVNSGIAEGVRIRIDPSNSKGQTIGDLAYGAYTVSGNLLIFTPRLPTAPITSSFSPASQNGADTSLPGLLPDTTYSIDLLLGTPNSIANLTKIKKKVVLPLKFTTVAVVQGPLNVASYFSNAPDKAPKADPAESKPSDGTTGVHPNTFNDPAGLFDAIPAAKRPPFKVRFKGPVNPSAENISSDNLRLRGIQDQNGAPVDVAVTADLVLTSNKSNKADVLVYPQGILPLGYTLAVEVSSKFQALSGASADPGPDPATWAEVVSYRIAQDPTPGVPIEDFVLENFDTTAHEDVTVAAGGQEPASWDEVNSNVLRASFGFAGDGSLGKFEPADVGQTINLDTDFQTFPLFDGSTPDVPPGTVVVGGVFKFTDFHLPTNVTLVIRGRNPAVFTCTGSFTCEGKIDLNGQDGTDDVTFDSAITPAPGGTAGAGGGRGGDGHPVVAPSGGVPLQYMQTPQFGQSGFAPGNSGPGGGGGGQCGCTLPWAPFAGDTTCSLYYYDAGDGSRGSGGGGGSFNVFAPTGPELDGWKDIPGVAFVSGRRGSIGLGNNLPVEFNPALAIPGEPSCYDGVTTNCVARPNPNPTFKDAYNQGLIYDNGALFNVTGGPTSWVQTHRITMFGSAGPGVFVDADPNNNYIFGGGEVQTLFGGQGGGGGGSRTEGLSQICKAVIFTQLKFPFTVLDAKGGGGGGSGGAMMVQALGVIELKGSKCSIQARGANGEGGEEIGGGSRGGAGGGGSGGAIILMSATNVIANDPTLAIANGDAGVGNVPVAIDVSPGCGFDGPTLTGVSGGEAQTLQAFDGGMGGMGIVQIHLPPGAPDLIDEAKINAEINPSVYGMDCTGSTPQQLNKSPLVDMSKTPSPLTPVSVARSTWYDLGAVTSAIRPPIVTTAGPLNGPLFGVPNEGPFFTGTDAQGFVVTDAVGNVTTPGDNDFEVDAVDLTPTPKGDFIPKTFPYYQSVRIRFEGADADPLNPGSPNLQTATGFVADPTAINGKRFVRFEVEFNIADQSQSPDVLPSATTPRPQMNFLRLRFRY